MNAVLGTAAVALALAGSVLGVITLAMGLKRGDARFLRSGQRYVWVVLGGAVLATVAMQSALLGHDFSLAYVARNGSRETPLLYTITGMWSALEGSILLWGLVLAGYLAVMARHFRSRASDPLVAWATLTGLVVAAFFFLLLAGPANPFKVGAGPTPFDGMGPNPLLQNHPLVAFHPPMLYLGYVGFTVPFAFAIAALATGRLGEGWLVETRRWTLFAWGFLTVGVVLGVWWSYEVLGWGGYWAWDPVENASFLPWLTATAYLHSVMVQERRGMLRVWNLSLLVATFSLTILGTFLTRSGVLDSVHAFSESAIGPMILAFFAVVVAVSVGLVAWRADRLRSPGTIDSPVSREGAFLANNVAFGAFAFVVLLGTVFPLIAEALRGDRLSVGAPYFERMTMPIGFTLLFLMAVAPALPWRRASTEVLHRRLLWPAWAGTLTVVACVAFGIRGFGPLVAFGLAAFAGAAAVRQLVLSVGAARESGAPLWRGLTGRSNGGMIVHLGVVLIAVGFAASSSFGHRHQFRLAPGESASLAGHTVTYLGFDVIDQPNKRTFRARVRIDGGQVYAPALHQFPGASLAIGSPSVRSGPIDDVYLTLVAPPDASSADPTAVIGVNIQPLVAWLWMGGAVMGFGTLLAAWPRDRRRRPPSGADPEPPSAAVPPEPDADDAIVPAALAEPAVAAEAPVVEPVGQPVPTVVLGQPVPTAGPVGQPVPTVVPVGQPVPPAGPVGQPVPPPGPVGQPVPTVVPVGQPVPTPGPVGQPVPTVVLGQPVPTPGPVGQPVPTVVLGQPVPTPGPVGQPVPTVVPGQPVPTEGPVGQPVPTPGPVGQPVPTVGSVGQPVPTPGPVGQPVPTVVPVGQPVPTVGPAALAEPTVVPVGQPVPTVVPVGQPVPTAGPAALAEPAVAAEVPG